MLSEIGFRGSMATNPLIMITLLVSSILMLAFFFERTWSFMVYGNWNKKLWKKLKNAVIAGRYHEARAICADSNNVFARVFHTSVSSTHLSRVDNEDLAQTAKENAQEVLRKRLGLFSTLSFIAPLVGLLGTVTGIMQAFNDLSRAGSGGANIVAAGISEALITTAAGIVVAVPAAVLFNYFTYRLRSIVVRMNSHSNELIILIYGGEEIGAKQAQRKVSEIHAKISR